MCRRTSAVVVALCAAGLLAAGTGVVRAQDPNGSIVAWGSNNYGKCNVPAPNSGFVAVAGGQDHSVGLKASGSIVAWGRNSGGQCNVPAPNSDFVAVAACSDYSLGLKSDGSIVAWGSGPGAPPAPNSGFVAIAAGYYHSLGLKADGAIVAWGNSAFCNVPAPNSGFVAVAAGYFHSLGLKADGSIVAWGRTYEGQCDVPAPNSGFVAVAGGYFDSLGLKLDGSIVGWGAIGSPPAPNSDFVAIAAGAYHGLGLKADGSIVAWGNNNYGQCNVPVPNSGFVAISAGFFHSFGLRGSGLFPDVPSTANPPDAASDVPITVGVLDWADTLRATTYEVHFGTASPPVLVGTTSTSEWCVGSLEPATTYYWEIVAVNAVGRRYGPVWSFTTIATAVPGTPSNPNPPDVAIGVSTSSVLDWAGTTQTLTYEVYFGAVNPPPLVGTTFASEWDPGPLELGTTYYWQVVAVNAMASTPGPVWSFTTVGLSPPEAPSNPNPPDAAVDVSHGVLLNWADADRATSYEVYFGAINPPPLVDTTVTSEWYAVAPELQTTTYYWQVVAVNSAGSTPGPVWSFTTTADELVAWGRDVNGESTVPAPRNGFVAISAGYTHSLGLKADGSIVAWGAGQCGASGEWDAGQCCIPAPNSGFVAVAAGMKCSLGLKADGSIVGWGELGAPPGPNSDFVDIAAGCHALGLKADGSIVGWGWNSSGQCDVPAPNTGFVAVAAGYSHSLGLKADGSIVAWGNNFLGCCSVPAPNTGFVAVVAGHDHSVGLKSDGSVVAWGRNIEQQCNVPAPNTGFVAVAAGYMHTQGLKSDGSIVAWGTAPSAPPAPNSGFVAIAASYFHSLGLKAPRGDLNADGSINAADYLLFRAAFGHCRPSIAYRSMMDYDLDGCITLADYQSWLQHYRDANAGLPTPPPLPVGDMNCDGVVSYADINPFVKALAGQAAYESSYPDCSWIGADINLDGAISYGDINPFVMLLVRQ